MTSTLNQTILISMLVFSSALAGCTQENEALTDDEIGELSVVVTLDFLGEGNQTTNLADRLSNGSITFDPVLVAENVSAYRVMEALQLRENFTIDVTYYVGLGAFIHTIDGVSGAEDWSTYWGFYQDGVMAEVGASTLLITSDTNLSWVLTPA
ncbi:MAG: DUF4430 domain-containing protein [Candidatus Thermoplasmatota archaeon]|jgi:hypothetical protein|nr:DUF4430 domain-containing protein [Candidatus Thermoplasmatota archaeon]MEC8722879.1 DUF4430 domain-containing protein [Candidatus Thermoplasmatota archaeon]|tara:strand:+ start:557 stop:1015 length:459 start_codon:yes stop_codon:yes gene_type:complete